MTTEHDEALVERVALVLFEKDNCAGGLHPADEFCGICNEYRDKARAVIYPPAPPKTRLQVARQIWGDSIDSTPLSGTSDAIRAGEYDSGAAIKAILAALALPAMED